ncbi:MAG: hypothetical protein NTX15_10180 [Candidatus Kapabacteria bacterium]|nr:hypothetical protein [Candidatus Kapabacteria bacterium]
MISRVVFILLLSTGLLSAQTSTQTPKTLIGTPTRVVLSTKNMLQSMAWWTKMGFSPVSRPTDKIDSAITLFDGQVVITLVKTSQPSPVLVYRCENIKSLKAKLDSLTIASTYDVEGPSFSELRLRSPNNVYLALRPETLEEDYKKVIALNPMCGKLTEFSAAASKVKPERQYWEDLGFVVVRGDSIPYEFVNMGDGHIEIGIHLDRDIVSTAFTYFMPDMEKRIENLRTSGIFPVEEIPTADNRKANAIYESPDGQLVFLFEGTK